MSTREAIAHLHAITGKIAGADMVEFNPAQDNTQITAMVAAKLLKEILGKMILDRKRAGSFVWGWTIASLP